MNGPNTPETLQGTNEHTQKVPNLDRWAALSEGSREQSPFPRKNRAPTHFRLEPLVGSPDKPKGPALLQARGSLVAAGFVHAALVL